MKYRGQDIKGYQQIAETFNEHVFSVSIEDNSDIAVPETAQPGIFLDDKTINAKDVLEEILQIKSGVNSYDQITLSLLKASAPYVINSILYIFSCIINACQFSESGKTYTCVLITKMVAKRKLRITDQLQCSVLFL